MHDGITLDLEPLAYPIEKLDELPGNPRRGDVAAIVRSYAAFGQRKPIVARRGADGRGVVIAGNHQLKAARELGWSHIAVVWVDDDDDTATAFALADNRTAELGDYDDELLAELIGSIADNDELLAASAWTADDLAALLDDDERNATSAAAPPYSDELVIELALKHYRSAGFPYPAMPVHECLQQVNRLAQTPSELLRGSTMAYHVPDGYHPHRFSVVVQGTVSPFAAFERDDKLTHALRLIVESGSLITDTSLLSHLSWVRAAQMASNFRPSVALWYVRRFCPDGGSWLDTSAGFGGRLVAFAASSAQRYVGIDPSTQSHDGNVRMAHDLQIADRVTLIKQPAEDVTREQLGEPFDFAFTSPPYFAKERYSDEPTQSFMRYGTADAWRESFLVPVIRLQYAALKRGSVAVVNIADVKLGGETVPLEQWTVDAALDAGFKLEATERMPMPRVPGRGERPGDGEPVFVLRK